MARQFQHHRTMVFLLLAAGIILACGVSLGAPQAAPTVDATTVALQLQGTAMSLQLTQAVLNGAAHAQSLTQSAAAEAQNTADALASQQPTPTETQHPAGTETVAPRVPLDPGAIEITYGQKLGSFPRKSEGVTYGFQGAKGDNVTIVLESSNARPKDAYCKTVSASTTFTLRTPSGQILATMEATHLSAIRDYQLPGSAAYYVLVTCTGGACNAYCTEADLSLEKK
jgi:hypothetical protein